LNIGQALGLKQDEAIASYNIGTLYEAQGNHAQALDWYQRALALREKLGNPKDIAETRERVAAVEDKLKKRKGKRKNVKREV
jgi:tetratricopeptide (TPR) repeat protein